MMTTTINTMMKTIKIKPAIPICIILFFLGMGIFSGVPKVIKYFNSEYATSSQEIKVANYHGLP